MNAFFGLEMLVVYFLATGKQSIRILQTVHNDRLECRVRILLYCPGDLMKPVSMFIMCSLPIFFSPKVICVTHGVDLRCVAVVKCYSIDFCRAQNGGCLVRKTKIGCLGCLLRSSFSFKRNVSFSTMVHRCLPQRFAIIFAQKESEELSTIQSSCIRCA